MTGNRPSTANCYADAIEELKNLYADAKQNQYEALKEKDYDHSGWYRFLEGIDAAIYRLEMKA